MKLWAIYFLTFSTAYLVLGTIIFLVVARSNPYADKYWDKVKSEWDDLHVDRAVLAILGMSLFSTATVYIIKNIAITITIN